MSNDNNIKQSVNAGEQSDTCGLISTPAHGYVPYCLFLARQLRDKHKATPDEIRWVLKVVDEFNNFKDMARRNGL